MKKQYEHVERILHNYENPVRDSTGTGFSEGHEKITGNGNEANEIVTQKINTGNCMQAKLAQNR